MLFFPTLQPWRKLDSRNGLGQLDGRDGGPGGTGGTGLGCRFPDLDGLVAGGGGENRVVVGPGAVPKDAGVCLVARYQLVWVRRYIWYHQKNVES